MKITFYLAWGLVLVLCLSGCSPEKTTVEKPTPEKPDRNMFGNYLPRGLTKTSENLAPGYIKFNGANSSYVYLANREGQIVHQWRGQYAVLNSYLLDDGSVLMEEWDPDYPTFLGDGAYGRLQKVDWEGKILWDFELATRQNIIHHDVAVLPNGNILAITYDVISFDEAVAHGRKPELTPKFNGGFMEKIIELEPVGKYDAKIVWEWQLKDHLVQNFDASKANYGNPAEHPELLDFNVGDSLAPAITQDSLDARIAEGKGHRNQTVDSFGSDFYHFNAINYNPDLDQIVVSSPHLDEVFIIDHSTTIKEAASHKGGRWGRGGDFLYRWGNPENYMQGDSTDQMLFGQHDVRWIPKELPGGGHLTVFNNNVPMGPDSLNYSAVYEIDPPMDDSGNYVLSQNGRFGPESPSWVYVAPDTISFYSSFISSAHRMANGHTLIDEGAKARFFEVTPDGEILWEYLNPFRGEIREPNGDPANMGMPYSNFRVTFIPADHAAFAGRELKPLDPQPKAFTLPPKEEKKS
ncbi:MAG: aryl-sulfate sulfotransferase [Bacteroidota bacterium]